MELNLKLFLYTLYPPFLLIIGLVGNSIVILAFTSKQMFQLSFSRYVIFMAISDSIGLLHILRPFFEYTFNYYLRNISVLYCKFFLYLVYVFNPISAWLMVFISLDKVISIRFPTKSFHFKKKITQNLIIFFIFLFNFLMFSPVFFLSELNIDNNNLKNESICSFQDISSVMFYFDLLNSIILPYLIMFFNTILLIYTVLKSRFKMFHKLKALQNINERKKKDIKFIFTSIGLNLAFLILNVPLIIYQFTQDVTISILANLYFINFAIDFFIHYSSNSLFRNEIRKIFLVNFFFNR